jgi:hypothetical protein
MNLYRRILVGLNGSTQHRILKRQDGVGDASGYFRGFTAAEKTELWDRWQGSKSLKPAIPHLLTVSSSSYPVDHL